MITFMAALTCWCSAWASRIAVDIREGFRRVCEPSGARAAMVAPCRMDTP